MQLGIPTPLMPARKAPPPVPPPSPGPRPPPEPLPIPVPLPCPSDSLAPLASGSPKVGALILETLKSGGPSREGSVGSLGLGFWIFTCGGVNCVIWNLGSLPRFTGAVVWAFAPPPPPAGFAPAGIFAKSGEISSGVTSVLFLACVEGRTRVKSGTTTNAISATCRPMEIACVQPKFSSFDQISFTLTGFTSNGNGACLGGENSSFRRVPNPPNPSTQPVESLLSVCPFGAFRPLKNSPTFSQNPPPYSVGIRSDFTSPRIFTGRSKRNCFRLDQKLSGINIGGRPNLGTGGDVRFVAEPSTFGRCGGPRLSIVPGKILRPCS